MADCVYGAVTDRGDRRSENQDSILCLTDREQEAGLFIVADGMGGLSRGGQVSRYIAERFALWWKRDFPEMIGNGEAEEDIREFLEQEIWDINQELLYFRKNEGSRFGSTLSLLLLYQENFYIENMGDSRIYLLRESLFRQLTEDQSLAAQLVREGQLSESEAESFPRKNVLTMCLGMFEIPRSNFISGKLQRGDVFLICSDGLHNQVCPDRMREILGRKELTAQERAKMLRACVPPGMGKDNISAILAEILE